MKARVKFHRTKAGGHLRLSGEDAATFLNSQFSGDLRNPEGGRCTYGLWLDAKGKVLGDGWVLCRDAELFEIMSVGTEGTILQEKLEKHIIADDVAIEVMEGTSLLWLQGEGAEAAVAKLLGAAPDKGRFIEGEGAVCFPGRRAQGSHYDICYTDASAADAAVAQLEAAGAEPVDAAAIELARIAAGYPAVPQELGAGDLPGEAGLVGEAVCTTKGCFLGQESILRLHNLGRARRGLYAVSGEGALPAVPSSVEVAGEERAAGELRSAYATATGWRGVAMLKLDRIESDLQCGNQPVTVEHAMGAVQ